MSDLSVILILVFAAASLAIYGVYWIFVFSRRENKIVNRRLELSQSIDEPTVVLETLRRERGFRNDNNPILRYFSDWLTQTGIRVQGTSLVLVLAALFLAWVIVFSLILGVGVLPIALAAIAAAGSLVLYLSRLRSKRIFAFSEQLPDALDVIVRGARVGLPFSSAVVLAAREMPDPVGTEFGMLADEVAFGLDVRTALENLHRRVGQDDLLFMTITVAVQTQTGGNIGEVLGRLSTLMRKRAAMRLKVKAMSSEGRASAFVLSALPFVLLGVIYFISPAYFAELRASTVLRPAIIIGSVMLLVGNYIMFRMVNFKY